MKLLKNKKLLVIVLLVMGAVLYFAVPRTLYGNDEESVVKVIRKVEGDKDLTAIIELVEIKDFGEHRVVSFLYDNTPAYAHFIKNSIGNYRWVYVEKSGGVSLAQFMVNRIRGGDDAPVMLFVANGDNEVAKIQVIVNGEVLETEITPHTMDVAWVEIPGTNEKSYRFDYVYYDEEGNRIGNDD